MGQKTHIRVHAFWGGTLVVYTVGAPSLTPRVVYTACWCIWRPVPFLGSFGPALLVYTETCPLELRFGGGCLGEGLYTTISGKQILHHWGSVLRAVGLCINSGLGANCVPNCIPGPKTAGTIPQHS